MHAVDLTMEISIITTLAYGGFYGRLSETHFENALKNL